MYLSIFSSFAVLFLNFQAYAQSECLNFLMPPKYDIVQPLLNANQILKLPSGLGRHESKFKSNVHEGIFKSLSFFRPSLEKLPGGLELFKIFESIDQQSLEELKVSLNNWSSEFLPGYELLFLDDVKKFKFKNSYQNKNSEIFNPEVGALDDKFLFELYANKKIPILKITDLVSKILVLTAPKLREQFEVLIALYLRGQALGDLTEEDVRYDRNRAVLRPYSNNDRLTYISTVMDLLTSRVFYLSPYDQSRQLVMFGPDNLISSLDALKTQEIQNEIDLSLFGTPKALSYFNGQALANNKSVTRFFNFLVKAKLLSKPAKEHMTQALLAHRNLAELTKHFYLLKLESKLQSDRLNETVEQSWIRFSNTIFEDRSNPIVQISRYGFRFEWLEYYIKIVETDIVTTESLSEKEQPGPLFR